MLASLAFVALAFAGTHLALGLLAVPYPGPLAVLAGLAATGWSLRARGDTLAALGLVRPGGSGRLLLASIGTAAAGYAAAIAATLLATRGLGWAPAEVARFADLPGNLPLLLGLLALSWTIAAFGEEVLFRGFLQPRLAAAFGGTGGAGILAAFAQALLFGLGHAYQGATGMLVTATLGLVFGLLYLRLRSLWPLVIAHGLIDSVGMLALFAGAGAPG